MVSEVSYLSVSCGVVPSAFCERNEYAILHGCVRMLGIRLNYGGPSGEIRKVHLRVCLGLKNGTRL